MRLRVCSVKWKSGKMRRKKGKEKNKNKFRVCLIDKTSEIEEYRTDDIFHPDA